jgi:salicylate hydroxylase
MTPQAVKHFYQWGLKEEILTQCVKVEKTFIRDYKSGSTIGVLNVADLEKQYGAPYVVLHRATLHDILHKHAIRSGAEIMLDSKVTEYDFENGAIVLKNGKMMEADLVIAADGEYFPHMPILSNTDQGRYQFLCTLPASSGS